MSLDVTCKRKRGWLGLVILICILFGLLSRSSYIKIPFFQEYIGDTLWAAMFYFIFTWIKPTAKWSTLLFTTLLFSYLIECSQLLQMPWLQMLRQTPLRYLLGQGFVWSDLICYSIGVIIACACDICLQLIQNERIKRQ